MITTLYQMVNKGSWRALSFIIALLITLFFFFNINEFASQLRVVSPFWVMAVIWATMILWIHGIGFDIRSVVWKSVFFPPFGYLIALIALLHNLL
ncbi:cyd operon protein YbgE [Necropsobacter massiliensis]|uniref:cyd operon protein YbgE n=1 Tax=Necropsobacter massiliensis TaxID=1400001 RepID=UPI000595F75A|nr:cyd operon protein YbgE [Necropsobacter massiliensis]